MIIIEGSIISTGTISYEGFTVTISSLETNMSYVTAQSGRFYFEGLPGTYTITVSKLGYLQYKITNLTAKDNMNYNFNDIPMYAGDSTNAGKISQESLNFIQNNLGQITRDNYFMDYDRDGEVTINDISIARENITRMSIPIKAIDFPHTEQEIILDDTEFRQQIFDYLKITVPEVLTTGDLEVWYKLVSYIYRRLI